jgi:hypothetical protein
VFLLESLQQRVTGIEVPKAPRGAAQFLQTIAAAEGIVGNQDQKLVAVRVHIRPPFLPAERHGKIMF